LSFKKIIDDVIIRRRQAVNLNNVLTVHVVQVHVVQYGTVQHALFKNKVDLFEDFSQKLIHTYNFIEFIPNFTNALYVQNRSFGERETIKRSRFGVAEARFSKILTMPRRISQFLEIYVKWV
jgi:hypothetical protein